MVINEMSRVTEKFARYEFKYLLNKKISSFIEDEVRYFMKYDGHIHPELGNRYFVRSLYFDNLLSSNFYEKVDGIKNRRKYRLRTYSKHLDKNVPIYLEEKGRRNERTYKVRTKINHNHIQYFLNRKYIRLLLSLYPDNQLIKNFSFDCIRKNIVPRVLIDYKRRPYINKHGTYFRLTFDESVSSIISSQLFIENKQWLECRAGYTILEVKFDRSMPPWFHRIIQNYNLRRLSISKFVIGMERCGIAYDI
jgi:hypothetical protein